MKRFLFLAVCIFSLLPPSLARACSPLLLTDSSPLQESVYPLDSLQRDTIAAIAPTEPVVIGYSCGAHRSWCLFYRFPF